MANNNGLISSRDVAGNGDINSNFFIRKGDAITVDTLTVDDTLTANNDVVFTNLDTFTVTGTQTGQRGTQLQRPVFVNATTDQLQIPTQPLIRFFVVATPAPTGSPVLLTDAAGAPYNASTWTCCVVGFANGGLGPGDADRTYQCLTYFDVNRNWYVQYDNAGNPCSVTIMAIHNSLYIDGSN